MTSSRWVLHRPLSLNELRRASDTWQAPVQIAAPLTQRGFTPAHLSSALTLTQNPGLQEAASVIIHAINNGKRIRIHGDYDADGVTATATLVLGLRAAGANVHGFIPHRTNDGYGISARRVPEHIAECDLFISVDCGVANPDEVRAIQAGGTEVIITDHHAPGEHFPPCLVIHPHLSPNYDHDHHNLTGAGVAYHLLWAVHRQLGLEDPTELSSVACIGTIADVAPVTGENRALIIRGLQELAATTRPGLKALLGAHQGPVTARDVAFGLAPRINAAGRLGAADLALELLLETNTDRAQQIATQLEELNTDRRAIQDQMYKQALELVNPDDDVIVVTHPDWHPGVMGIVASKLTETFSKPTFIIAAGKGSARSLPGLHATQALKAAAHLLIKFGGHPGAAGFSIDMNNVSALRAHLNAYAKDHPARPKALRAEAPLPISWITETGQAMTAFEPFGHEYPEIHYLTNATFDETKLVGQNQSTLQFKTRGTKGVCYNHGPAAPGEHQVLFTPRANTWKGRTNYELFSHGLRPNEALPLDNSGSAPGVTATVQRITPAQGVTQLRSGASPIGDAAILQHLGQDLTPEQAQLQALQRSGPCVLFTLPEPQVLQALLSQPRTVLFAFGPKTHERLSQGHCGEDRAEQYHHAQWSLILQNVRDEDLSEALGCLCPEARSAALPPEIRQPHATVSA